MCVIVTPFDVGPSLTRWLNLRELRFQLSDPLITLSDHLAKLLNREPRLIDQNENPIHQPTSFATTVTAPSTDRYFKSPSST